MSNPGFLFAGFALAWVVAFGYLWLLSRHSANVERQLEALERRVGDGDD